MCLRCLMTVLPPIAEKLAESVGEGPHHGHVETFDAVVPAVHDHIGSPDPQGVVKRQILNKVVVAQDLDDVDFKLPQ